MVVTGHVGWWLHGVWSKRCAFGLVDLMVVEVIEDVVVMIVEATVVVMGDSWFVEKKVEMGLGPPFVDSAGGIL